MNPISVFFEDARGEERQEMPERDGRDGRDGREGGKSYTYYVVEQFVSEVLDFSSQYGSDASTYVGLTYVR